LDDVAIDRSRSIAPQIYDTLRTRIIDNRFPPGTALSESEVARFCDISHTPLRAAIQDLAGDGLIIVRPQVGSVVAPCDAARVREAIFIRAAIEAAIARRLAETDAGKRTAFADRFGFPTVDSIDELADDSEIGAVILITPPNQSLDLVRCFAEAGKHILMEKPVERTTPAAEEIVQVCDDNRVRLGIVFQHRFRQASQALQRRIASGALGACWHCPGVRSLVARAGIHDEPGRGTYERDGGGVLISQAITRGTSC